MNESKTNSEKLLAVIEDLEQQHKSEMENLKNNFHGVKESLTPKALASDALHRLKESPKLRMQVFGGLIGVALVIAGKIIISKRTGERHRPVKERRATVVGQIAQPVSRVLQPLLKVFALALVKRNASRVNSSSAK